jgi:hypothetical protein
VSSFHVSLCLINYAPCHEDIWRRVSIVPLFLTLAVNEDEWSASRPGHFTPGERAPGTHSIGGKVRPRASLDIVE